MSLKNILKNYYIIIIVALIFSFWGGFFVTENIYNQNNTYYSVQVKSETIKLDKIDEDFFLSALLKPDGTYSYSSVKPVKIFSENGIITSKENDVLTIKIKAKYFIGTDENVISYKSLDRFEKVMKKVLAKQDSDSVIQGIETISYYEPYGIGFISLGAGFFITLFVFYLIRKKLKFADDSIYESGKIFKNPFNVKFWDSALKEVRNLKVFNMCFIAVLFALQLSLKTIKIYTGFANLTIGITYLVFAYICLIYGPVWGLIIGFGSDVIGFMIAPDNVFHFGYTIQAMLTGFVYGLCLYKTNVTFSKVLLCRIIVNILLNAVYGSILQASISLFNYEATMTYFYAVMLPKNIVYLIPQSLLLYGFLKLTVPLLIKRGIVPKNVI